MISPRTRIIGVLATLTALPLALITVGAPALAAPDATPSVDPIRFANPDITYRPGVRWWWPGNGATTEDLVAQVEYLHDNGFGAVEIVAFSKGFLTGNGTTTGYFYDSAGLGYDTDQIASYESPEYFDKLDAVIARANEIGITVDLNIGSGYLANDDSVALEDSQATMALGRQSIDVSPDAPMTLTIPEVEASPIFATEKFGFDFAEWDADNAQLSAVIIARITDEGEALTTNNQSLSADLSTVITYPNQTVVDLANATVLYPATGATTVDLDTSDMEAGPYEVIALYSTNTGSFGLNSIIENTTTGRRNRVVDHLDGGAVTRMINGWLSEAGLRQIVDSRDIRAAFNDSYEFYTDAHYNSVVQAAAQSQALLGYDITKFIPSFYQFFGESFLIDGAPTIKDQYAAEGLADLTLSRFSGGDVALLSSGLSDDEAARVSYDYAQLLNAAFHEGMSAFSQTLADYGIVYRQQAYNPPIDILGAAEFIDIPETEGLNEYNIKRVSSGAHLYGKNLVTSEVFTLGSVPYTVTPDFLKRGYDLMATSGVNNFFYHGLSATYHGSEDLTSDDGLFPEEGWRAWPTIGVSMEATNPLSTYFPTLNAYASRANYTMQLGSPNADVAVYKPMLKDLAVSAGYNGGSTPISTITALETNGFAWDMINDDTIQDGLEWTGSELVANGNMSFDALVVETDAVPVDTLEALKALADAGAPIFFHATAVASQPGYADGDYAALDARAVELFNAMGGLTATDALVSELKANSNAAISYAANDSIRFNRRSLDEGGELAYFRNTSTDMPTALTIEVADESASCYWLDIDNGTIHEAEVAQGSAPVFLEAAGAVGLVCEPRGVSFAAEDLSEGAPESIAVFSGEQSLGLTGFTLEVTADNIGSQTPGGEATVTWGEDGADVLGDWSDPGVLDGALACVADSGVYRMTLTVSNAEEVRSGGALLDLGTVNYAATVRVNPGTGSAVEKQLVHSPFTVDISDALVDGANVIEVEVQPVKNNRRVCLKRAWQSDPETNAQYMAYEALHGSSELMPAGMVGPVQLRTAVGVDQTEPTLRPSVALSDMTVERGQTITITGAGFASGMEVAARFHSDPVDIGVAPADAEGSVAFSFTIPSDAELGSHRIVLSQDAGVEASAELTVVEAAPAESGTVDGEGDSKTPAKGGLASTGASDTALLLTAAALVGCAGMMLRRRANR